MFLVWTKPGVALGLTEEPVKKGVVAVVVHGQFEVNWTGIKGSGSVTWGQMGREVTSQVQYILAEFGIGGC